MSIGREPALSQRAQSIEDDEEICAYYGMKFLDLYVKIAIGSALIGASLVCS